MNLEELQAMSNTELNELAAVKVMGWTKINEKYYTDANYIKGSSNKRVTRTIEDTSFGKSWNPTGDMNDAMELLNQFSDFIIRKYNNGEYFNVAIIIDENEPPVQCLIYEGENKLNRAITIASILAKGD